MNIQKNGDYVTHLPEMDNEAMKAAIGPKTKAIVPADRTSSRYGRFRAQFWSNP